VFISCFFFGFLLFHYIAVWNIKVDERASDVYYATHASNVAVEKLGLLTTVRLDVQRNLTGWSPEIDQAPFTDNFVTGDKINENNYDDITLDENDYQSEPEAEEIEENKLDIPFEQLMEQSDN